MKHKLNKHSGSLKAPLSVTFAVLATLGTYVTATILIIAGVFLAAYLGFIEAYTDQLSAVIICSGLLIQLLLVGTLLWHRRRTTTLNLSDIGLRKFKLGQAIKYIVGYYVSGFIIVILLAIIATALGVSGSEDELDSLARTPDGLLLVLFIAAVMAPILEEIVYRGILFRALSDRYRFAIAGTVTTLVFTIAHLDLVTAISVIPLGFYLCIMAKRLNSIVPGMILHASWNILVTIIRY